MSEITVLTLYHRRTKQPLLSLSTNDLRGISLPGRRLAGVDLGPKYPWVTAKAVAAGLILGSAISWFRVSVAADESQFELLFGPTLLTALTLALRYAAPHCVNAVLKSSIALLCIIGATLLQISWGLQPLGAVFVGAIVAGCLPLMALEWLRAVQFRGRNLDDSDLTGADLSQAVLRFADLKRAKLSEANLSRADLSHADLSDADLSRADLTHANLEYANLRGANLTGARLTRCNAECATFRAANLSVTDFCSANLTGADLRDARIRGTIFTDAKLRSVIGTDALSGRENSPD